MTPSDIRMLATVVFTLIAVCGVVLSIRTNRRTRSELAATAADIRRMRSEQHATVLEHLKTATVRVMPPVVIVDFGAQWCVAVRAGSAVIPWYVPKSVHTEEHEALTAFNAEMNATDKGAL